MSPSYTRVLTLKTLHAPDGLQAEAHDGDYAGREDGGGVRLRRSGKGVRSGAARCWRRRARHRDRPHLRAPGLARYPIHVHFSLVWIAISRVFVFSPIRSMDGFLVVRLSEMVHKTDLIVTATGTPQHC